MAVVNTANIMTKIKNWEKSIQGQMRISTAKQTLKNGSISDVSVQGTKLAQKLLGIIQSHLPISISDTDLSASVISTPEYDGTQEMYKIQISFPETELYRDSLYPEGYPNGCYNIIALLNKGYHARDYVYGDWHGERVRSIKDRIGEQFMQEAVNDFNSQYGQEYMCFVELSEDY